MLDKPNPRGPGSCGIDPGRDLSERPRILTVTRRKMVIGAAATAIVYLAGVTGQWWATPDSAIYLELARSVATGHGYVADGAVNARYPPGLPLALAGLRYLFGDGYWAANLFIALCGIAAAAAIYLAMREMTRETERAYAVTLSTVFSYGFYSFSHRIMSDVPYTLAFWLMMYAALRYVGGARRWLIAAVVMSAVGTLIRLPGILLAVSAAVGLALQQGAQRARRMVAGAAIVTAGGVVCLGFFAFARMAGGVTPNYVNTVAPFVTDPVSHLGARTAATAVALARTVTQVFAGQEAMWPLGLAAIALGLAGLVVLWRSGEKLPVALAVLYPAFLAELLNANGMNVRYFLPVAPVMFYALLSGVGWGAQAICALKAKPYPRAAARWAIAATACISIAANFPRVAREAFYFSYLSHTPRYFKEIHPNNPTTFLEAADTVERYCPKDATVGAEPGAVGIISYLTGRRTVSIIKLSGRDESHDVVNALDFVKKRRDVDFILVTSGLSGEVRNRMRAALDADASFECVCNAPLAYRRVR